MFLHWENGRLLLNLEKSLLELEQSANALLFSSSFLSFICGGGSCATPIHESQSTTWLGVGSVYQVGPGIRSLGLVASFFTC